jgi:hypothetical chaperone protein
LKNILYIDFGTTNSAILTSNNNSLLTKTILFYLQDEKNFYWGDEAWDFFISGEPGRLFRALKTFLAGGPVRTKIGPRMYTLSDLIAFFLKNIKETIEAQEKSTFNKVILGRPVVFRNQDSKKDEKNALRRLHKAAEIAGFNDISFVFEPVAAAFGLGESLKGKTLIGDFGGGTSDFTIIDFSKTDRPKTLSIGGLGIGGDVFDGDLLEVFLGDFFGIKSTIRYPLGNGGDIPFPRKFINLLKEWSLIPQLGTPNQIRELKQIYQISSERDLIDNLLEVAEYNLGFEVISTVEEMKKKFSRHKKVTLDLKSIGLSFKKEIEISEFEKALYPRIEQIDSEVKETIDRSGLKKEEIDHVFLTGGSSKINVIRRFFLDKFFNKVIISEKADDIVRGMEKAIKFFP